MLGFVLLFGVAALTFLGVRGVWRAGRRELLLRQGKPTTFEEIGAAYSLTQVGPNELAGERDGMHLRVLRVDDIPLPSVLIEVRSDEIPKMLEVSQETLAAALRGEIDIVVGDRAFDNHALVRGDLLAALTLTQEARDAYLAISTPVQIRAGTVSTHTKGDLTRLPAQIDEVLGLARAVACPESELLERAIRHLPNTAGERAVAVFNELRARVPDAELARVIELGLTHHDGEVRVAAATIAKIDTTAMLRELIEARKTSDRARAKALELLATRGRLPDGVVLLNLLGRAEGATIRAIGLHAPASISLEVEAMLIAVVGVANGARRVAAIEALEQHGTGNALAVLQNVSWGLGLPAEVKAAAKKSIAAIQERRAGRGGQLAIADDHSSGGSLSITSTGGELSTSSVSSSTGAASSTGGATSTGAGPGMDGTGAQ